MDPKEHFSSFVRALRRCSTPAPDLLVTNKSEDDHEPLPVLSVGKRESAWFAVRAIPRWLVARVKSKCYQKKPPGITSLEEQKALDALAAYRAMVAAEIGNILDNGELLRLLDLLSQVDSSLKCVIKKRDQLREKASGLEGRDVFVPITYVRQDTFHKTPSYCLLCDHRKPPAGLRLGVSSWSDAEAILKIVGDERGLIVSEEGGWHVRIVGCSTHYFREYLCKVIQTSGGFHKSHIAIASYPWLAKV